MTLLQITKSFTGSSAKVSSTYNSGNDPVVTRAFYIDHLKYTDGYKAIVRVLWSSLWKYRGLWAHRDSLSRSFQQIHARLHDPSWILSYILFHLPLLVSNIDICKYSFTYSKRTKKEQMFHVLLILQHDRRITQGRPHQQKRRRHNRVMNVKRLKYCMNLLYLCSNFFIHISIIYKRYIHIYNT